MKKDEMLKDIRREDKRIAKLERAKEKYQEAMDTKSEKKALKEYEKALDKDLGLC